MNSFLNATKFANFPPVPALHCLIKECC